MIPSIDDNFKFLVFSENLNSLCGLSNELGGFYQNFKSRENNREELFKYLDREAYSDFYECLKNDKNLEPSRKQYIFNRFNDLVQELFGMPPSEIENVYKNGSYHGEDLATEEYVMAHEKKYFTQYEEDLELIIKDKSREYVRMLEEYKRNWHYSLTNDDEEIAEKRLFQVFSDLAYVVDVINRKNFWHQDSALETNSDLNKDDFLENLSDSE